MEPGRRFYWVPGLSREKVPCGIWSALASDGEASGLTNSVLGSHEGGRRPGLCVGLRESWRLVQYVPMYMSETRGGGGERRGRDEPDNEFTWFWKRRKYVV